jgi:hypothetical protein
MKIAAVLARHRRLLALCGLSLLAHVLLIEWIAVRMQPSPARKAFTDALAVRLQPASAPAAAAPPVPATAARATPAAATPAPAAPAPPATAAPSARTAADAPPVAPTATPDAAALAAGAQGAIAADQAVETPGRYRVRMPPAGLLTYVQTSSRAGQPDTAAGEARISWQTEGGNYWLRIDGVLGRLASEGASSEAGIAPRVASEELADGARALTRFDNGHIVFDLAGRSLPAAPGAQDRASLLMQLTGMGLAEPGQIGGVIEIVVAGAAGASVVRFQVLGPEEVATGLGPTAAVHLAQLAPPGEARLDLWLAPERSWYPVQLRVTAADGSASTQVLARIDEPLPPS